MVDGQGAASAARPFVEAAAAIPAPIPVTVGKGDDDRIPADPVAERQPPHGAHCLAKHRLSSVVLANWDDDDATTILPNCRQAMDGHGRLLIFEPVLPEGSQPHIGKMFDMIMLVVLGGRIRTEPEFRQLLDRSGFEFRGVSPGAGAFSVVEAAPLP